MVQHPTRVDIVLAFPNDSRLLAIRSAKAMHGSRRNGLRSDGKTSIRSISSGYRTGSMRMEVSRILLRVLHVTPWYMHGSFRLG